MFWPYSESFLVLVNAYQASEWEIVEHVSVFYFYKGFLPNDAWFEQPEQLFHASLAVDFHVKLFRKSMLSIVNIVKTFGFSPNSRPFLSCSNRVD